MLNREGNAASWMRPTIGFHAPYASRVRRFDECFSGFIADLKARGLYDDSVIVLTSDHGDSLGEDGRWGHAYTIYPEVLQVPLIVHVPPALRQRLEAAPDAVAFTTDITPTLYALLGHEVRPQPASPIFGRPLLWPAGTARPAAPPFGLVASSYGSVYGWLDDDGRRLYIADGVALRDYEYRLDGSPTGLSMPVSAAGRAGGAAMHGSAPESPAPRVTRPSARASRRYRRGLEPIYPAVRRVGCALVACAALPVPAALPEPRRGGRACARSPADFGR